MTTIEINLGRATTPFWGTLKSSLKFISSQKQSDPKPRLDIFIHEIQSDFGKILLLVVVKIRTCLNLMHSHLAFPQNTGKQLSKGNIASTGSDRRYYTSFSEYKERATMSRSFFVSAWNSCLETEPSNESQTQPIKFNFYFHRICYVTFKRSLR